MADLRVPDIARVQLAGRLTRDPELRYSASGKAFTTFALAYSRNYRDRDNMTKQESHFFDCKCFDKSAEYLGTKLKKGAPVYVEGRLSTEQWTDKTTGAKRSKVVVLADRVQSLTWDTLNADAPKESKLDAMAQDAPAADEDIPF